MRCRDEWGELTVAVSIRPALTAGLAAVCAGTLTFTATTAPQAASVLTRSEQVVSYQVDLRASTELVMPQELLAAVSALSPAQVLTVANVLSTGAATPTIAPLPGLTALADAIDGIYNVVEPWVRYGFQVAASVVAWIPWVGIFANQIMVVYNFVESLINSGVYNVTDWMRGEGSALKNIADWVVDLGLAVVWLGIDEASAWIPLPPAFPYPPRPPWADLSEGIFGDVVVGASQLLADVSNAIWNIWEPIKSVIGNGVAFTGDLLDAISFIPFVPLINFQIQQGWELIAGEGDALTGFAHDMINAGNQWVADTVNGDGLIAATVNAAVATWNSIGARIGQAVQALVDWGAAQVDYFFGWLTPGAASTLAEQQVSSAKSVDIETLSVDTPVAETAAVTSATTDEDAVRSAADDAPVAATVEPAVAAPVEEAPVEEAPAVVESEAPTATEDTAEATDLPDSGDAEDADGQEDSPSASTSAEDTDAEQTPTTDDTPDTPSSEPDKPAAAQDHDTSGGDDSGSAK